MPTSHDRRIRAQLDHARAHGLERRLPAVDARHGLRYRLDGREVTSFCSNDYLGYACEDAPHLPPTPSGSSGSRLVSGDSPIHRSAEQCLAEIVGLEDAVLFPSGFQLNVGVLPALLHVSDQAYSDALNHASLVDGLRLAKANREILAHRCPPPAQTDGNGFAWWITESIFSMDGDGPDGQHLQRHLQAGGCLYLDEAHAFGLHAHGAGRARELDLTPTALVGPLGKAFGYAGAFIAASHTTCEWLRTHARSFVFTTGITPTAASHILARAEQIRGPDGDARRSRLWANVRRFASQLGRRDNTLPSPIFPFHVGSNHAALAVSAGLLERGWHVQPIRPPTVPEGTARLRVCISAAHEPYEIDQLAHDLAAMLAQSDLTIPTPTSTPT